MNRIGIHLGMTSYFNAILQFDADISIEELIEIMSDTSFNEYDCIDNLSDMLYSIGIKNYNSNVFLLDEQVTVSDVKMWEDAEKYAEKMSKNYDIYIEVLQESKEEETIQYVYVYSSEWKKAKSVRHAVKVWNENQFSNEEYVAFLSMKEKPYKFSLKADIVTQVNTACPYYDRYIILKYIKDIDDCNDLVDYVEEETMEKLRNI